MRTIVFARARCVVHADRAGDARHVDERPLEQTELELRREHAPDRVVEGLLVDEAPADSLEQGCAVAVGLRKLDIDPGLERRRRGVRGVLGEPVVRLDLPHREVVGHDRAVELPAVPQQPRQERAVRGARHAVDLVVGVHHGAQPRGRVPRPRTGGGRRRGARTRRSAPGAQFMPPSDAP